jgi:hypothetical protein
MGAVVFTVGAFAGRYGIGETLVGLLLQAVDVVDHFHWRWLLTDEATGAPLADHTATIDPATPEAEAFADLYRFLRWHAEPDRRLQTETAWIDRLGAWIGEQILGATIGRAIVAAAPVAVRVVVPESAQFLLFWPLELAHVDGVPLARRGDVSLVFDIGRAAPAEKARVGERLRMLAVFSLPTHTTALALRRERYKLTRLVRRLRIHKKALRDSTLGRLLAKLVSHVLPPS